MNKFFSKTPMPIFKMYSKLDKNLLKQMVLTVIDIDDSELPAIKDKYFNPPVESEKSEGKLN